MKRLFFPIVLILMVLSALWQTAPGVGASATDENSIPATAGLMSAYPKPDMYPIEGHPRLFVTQADIPAMKENAAKEPLSTVWKSLKSQASDTALTGILTENSSGNYDETVLNKIMARALMSLMGEESSAEYARKTIECAKNYMNTVTFPDETDVTRKIGRVMVMGAIVYDWCFDELTDDEKLFFAQKLEGLCAMKEIGYPFGPDVGGVAGHGMEAEVLRDALAAGIAIYDEYPDMYNYAGGTYFSSMVPTIAYINQSGKHPAGDSYGPYRFQWEAISAVLFERMGLGNPVGDNIKKVPYYWLYTRLPEGIVFSEGDSWIKETGTIYYDVYYHQAFLPMMALTDDPYIKAHWLKELSIYSYGYEPFWTFVYAGPENLELTEGKFEDDLPLTLRTNYPFTSLVARTSWQTGLDSDTAACYMHASERNIFDHSHRDVGQFQIYYKGLLAMDAGAYDGYGSNHDYNYAKRSAAHNVITVYDPNEKFYYKPGTRILSNDGGQRHTNAPIVTESLDDLANNDEFKTAETKGVYIGPNEKTPEFSYIKTNLKPAYSDKVTDYKRSMVFMDLNNKDYPAAFVVYDKIDSSNSDFKKTWMLHCAEEPLVSGSKTIIRRTESDYNGKLVVETMLPENHTITPVGPGFTAADGVDYPIINGLAPSGNAPWKIDVSPATAQKEDVFLHAMYVTDADGNLCDLPMTYDSTATHQTVTVMDRIVMFSKDSENVASAFDFTVSGDYSEMACLIADVAPGKWCISTNGVSINVESKEDEGCLYARLPHGSYTIAPIDAGASLSTVAAPEMEKEKIGDFRIYMQDTQKEFLYLPSPARVINSVPYISANTVLRVLGCEVETDGTAVIATKNGNEAKILPDSAYYMYNGYETAIRYETVLLDGEVYIPVGEFASFLGYSFRYDSYAAILYVTGDGIVPNIKLTSLSNGSVISGSKVTLGIEMSDLPSIPVLTAYVNGKASAVRATASYLNLKCNDGINEIRVLLTDLNGNFICASNTVIVNCAVDSIDVQYKYPEIGWCIDLDFESETDPIAPYPGRINVGGSSLAELAQKDTSHGISYKLSSTGAEHYLSTAASTSPGYDYRLTNKHTVFEFEFCPESMTASEIHIMNLKYNGSKWINPVRLANDGAVSFELYNSGGMYTLSSPVKAENGKWTKLKFIFYAGSNLTDIYINGNAFITAGQLFPEGTSLTCVNYPKLTAVSASYYVDNIRLYTVTKSTNMIADVSKSGSEVSALLGNDGSYELAVCIIAVKDKSGALENAAILPFGFTDGETVKLLRHDFGEIDADSEVSVYLWNSMERIVPLCTKKVAD